MTPPSRSAESQHAHVIGDGNVVVQILGDNNEISVAGSPRLTLTTYPSRQRAAVTELDLLDPIRRTTRLVGREKDFDDLWKFLHSSRKISVRTLIGCAGAGKTRLAIDLMAQLDERFPGQWHFGFVTDRELFRFSAMQNLSSWGWQKPTLIVADYAATLVEPLSVWLKELAEHSSGDTPALRIILLEREATLESGWLSALNDHSWSGAGVQDLFDPLEPVPVQTLADKQARRSLLGEFLRTAAEFNEVPPPQLPATNADEILEACLASDVWQDPLYLMMAALVAIGAEIPLITVLSLNRTDVATHLAQRELQRLARFAPPKSKSARLIEHIAACATLCDGFAHEEALSTVRKELIALSRDYPEGAGALVDAVRDALPRADGGISPIIPDIVGEALILEVLASKDAISTPESVVARLLSDFPRNVIASLIRCVQDFCPPPALKRDPLDWIKSLIESGEIKSLQQLTLIEAAMPFESIELREPAADVTYRLIGAISSDAQAGCDDLQEKLGRLLANYSIRLGQLDRFEDALESAIQAERIYRHLASLHGDAVSPRLAAALGNVAYALGNLGDYEGSLEKIAEAEGIYRQLTTQDSPARQLHLALILLSRATTLRPLGQSECALEKATEAETILRQLTLDDPDRFLPHLATALICLAEVHRSLGHHQDAHLAAVECERIYRQLAAGRADSYLPGWATSLTTLANTFGELGKRDKALLMATEAEVVLRDLVRRRRHIFQSSLANALVNLSIRLGDLGHRRDAYERALEAESIYRKMVDDRPKAHLADLGLAVDNVANRLSELGFRKEAVEKAIVAEDIRHRLASANPVAYTHDWAQSLNNLANKLDDLGRYDEALEKSIHAEQLYRELASSRPDVFLPHLAGIQMNLSSKLRSLGRFEDSYNRAVEAESICRKLVLSLPETFLPRLAAALINLANSLGDLGLFDEALEKATEAERIHAQLAAAAPAAYLPNWALSINNVAGCLTRFGRNDEAATKMLQAEQIRRQLAEEMPDVFLPDWAMSLNNLAITFNSVRRHEEALNAAVENERVSRHLVALFPDTHKRDLANALTTVSTTLCHLGKSEEALAKATEAENMYRELAMQSPETYTFEWARSIAVVATCHKVARRFFDAADSYRTGIATLAGPFQHRPKAFAALMTGMVQQYVKSCEWIGIPVDIELVDPIAKVLNQTNK